MCVGVHACVWVCVHVCVEARGDIHWERSTSFKIEIKKNDSHMCVSACGFVHIRM